MNSVAANSLLFSSSSSPLFLIINRRCPTQLSFSTPRRSRTRRRRIKSDDNSRYYLRRSIHFESSPDNQNVKLVLDFEQISSLPSSRFHQLLSFSREAYDDLKNVISIDPQNRTIQVSFRKSTLQFLGGLFLCGFVVAVAFRILFKVASGLRSRFSSKENVIVRRDRSLGGREVIVGTRKDSKQLRPLESPLSSARAIGPALGRDKPHYRVQEKLPQWWPATVADGHGGLVLNREFYQTEATRLVRAITDNRTVGKDITEDEIIQLRRICRTSGLQVSFDTTNTRDSFYRTAIELVLNVCSRVPSQSTSVEIDGEDAQQFIAGLAGNIRLEKARAARMVSAAVAARMRLRFLQAWAFEMQGKHSEAVSELSKICLVLRIFPPEESSPELEMVARGLEKVLKVEQRELLMGMLVGVCGEESHRSAAEALGLVC